MRYSMMAMAVASVGNFTTAASYGRQDHHHQYQNRGNYERQADRTGEEHGRVAA
jgi:hypothetical protein